MLPEQQASGRSGGEKEVVDLVGKISSTKKPEESYKSKSDGGRMIHRKGNSKLVRRRQVDKKKSIYDSSSGPGCNYYSAEKQSSKTKGTV